MSREILITNEPGANAMGLRLEGQAKDYKMTFHVEGSLLWIRWRGRHESIVAERTVVELPSLCYSWTHDPDEPNYWRRTVYQYNKDEVKKFLCNVS